MKARLNGREGKILLLETGHRTRRQVLRDRLLPAVHRIQGRCGLVETHIHSRMFSNGYASEVLPVFGLGLWIAAPIDGKSCRKLSDARQKPSGRRPSVRARQLDDLPANALNANAGYALTFALQGHHRLARSRGGVDVRGRGSRQWRERRA